MSRSESYVTVSVKLLEKREHSIRVDQAGLVAPAWLPRAWVEVGDNQVIDKAQEYEDLTIRILGDKAVEKGLI
jgi:hypothetical protein